MQKLFVISNERNPRIHYTMDLVFERILGVAYELILPADFQPDLHVYSINYSAEKLGTAVSIYCSGILAESHIREEWPEVSMAENAYLFPKPESAKGSVTIDFDLFGAAFYLVSDYEKYSQRHLDRYDRYNPQAYPSANWDLENIPLVHLYCEELWKALIDAVGQDYLPIRVARKFDFELTFDIDLPWKYMHKPAWIAWGGGVKEILTGKWGKALARFSSLLSGIDPNDTFSLIFQECPVEKTTFFFLIDRNAPEDSRFTYRNPHLRKLIQNINQKGYSVGIHPSFSSFLDEDRLKLETSALTEIVEKPVVRSRQHFLRYRLPQTYRYLIELGIREEYSACLFQTAGFPNGMAIPFPWFDLKKNEATELMIHPTQVMDRTLQQYLQHSPEAAFAHTQSLIKTTQKYGGKFTLLIHNDALSETDEWTGWRSSLLEMIRSLTKDQ